MTLTAAQIGVTRSLDRGRSYGLIGVAVFLPGEEVRCPRHRSQPDGGPGALCAAYLFTLGPESSASVRVYEVERFRERRNVARGNYRCHRCEGRIEVEHYVGRAPPVPD